MLVHKNKPVFEPGTWYQWLILSLGNASPANRLSLGLGVMSVA